MVDKSILVYTLLVPRPTSICLAVFLSDKDTTESASTFHLGIVGCGFRWCSMLL